MSRASWEHIISDHGNDRIVSTIATSDGGSSEAYRSDEEEGSMGFGPELIETLSHTVINGIREYEVGDLRGRSSITWKGDFEPNIMSREQDGLDRPTSIDPHRSFLNISAMIAHPSSSADPLRGSRKPLPPAPTGAKSLLKAPPAVLFDEYLGHLLTNETSNADEENVATPWHQFRDAGGLDDVDSAYSARNTRSSGMPESLAIPDVFLTTGFDLTNPAVWAQIVEGEDADRIEETSSNLTQYVDHLEAHLIYEISQRAPMFFSALTNLQALAAESAICLSRIESLQYKLSHLDQTTTISGIDCAVNYALVDIKKDLVKGLRSIQGIATATNLANEMLQHGDWGGALDALIHIAEWWIDQGRTKALAMPAQPELLCTEDRRLLDNIVEETENENETEADVSILGQSLQAIEDALPLHQIPAVQKIPGQMLSLLESLKAQVESEIQAQLSRALANENEISTYPYGTQKLNADLVKLLEAHLRCGGASSAITQIWQACSFRAVRDSLRQHLPYSEELTLEDDKENGAGTKRNIGFALNEMQHADFQSLLDLMFSSMLGRIRLIKHVNSILEEAFGQRKHADNLPDLFTSSLSQRGKDLDSSSTVASELRTILVSVCELANSRSAKIFGARARTNVNVHLADFIGMIGQARAFVIDTEIIAGEMISPLRALLTSQSRSYLHTFHNTQLQSSAKDVEEEQWVQVEISPVTQLEADNVVLSATEDPSNYILHPRSAHEPAPMPDRSREVENRRSHSKCLRIEDREFFLVSATTKAIQLLCEYIKLVFNLEGLATDVMTKMVEFLKSFNSRTCQVVLGAGAMRSAGLKNITAKHLALASQSLSVIITLIPYVRETVRRHLNSKQAVMLTEFDKLKRDYQEHQYEIHSKLIAIMADRLTIHAASLKTVEWEAGSNSSVHTYAELLVKETTTLHKVLSKYLESTTVQAIMLQVIESIRQKLYPQYTEIELKSDLAKKSLQADIEFLVNGLAHLTSGDIPSPVADLIDLAHNKSIPKRGTNVSASINGFLRRGPKPAQPDQAGVELPLDSNASPSADLGTDEGDEGLDIMSHTPQPNRDDPKKLGSSTLYNMEGRFPADVRSVAETLEDYITPSTGHDTDFSESYTSTPRNYFEELDVSQTASEEEIRKSYRTLMLQLHPDRQIQADRTALITPLNEARLHRVNEAYETLSNAKSRNDYVSWLKTATVEKTAPKNSTRPTRTISLDDFDHHTSAESTYYTHECRCSSQLTITEEQLDQSIDIIECDGCGERVGVTYRAVSDDEI